MNEKYQKSLAAAISYFYFFALITVDSLCPKMLTRESHFVDFWRKHHNKKRKKKEDGPLQIKMECWAGPSCCRNEWRKSNCVRTRIVSLFRNRENSLSHPA
jgi:hypothetical protein